MDDWQLLQSYVEQDSEAAFRTLVTRYVNVVYSVAQRQVRDVQLAEEVAQAVFLLLARKARGFRRGVVLSGWLFRTTRFVASRAVRTEQRRRQREQEAFAMQQLTSSDDAWEAISPAVDEALEHLGETDRNALLLRFFIGKSHRETAEALGLSEDATKKRVTRALEKVRGFFATRGVRLSATLLVSSVAANAAKAAPPEVAASVAARVFASGASAAGFLPPLVKQTLDAWRWAKLTIAGAAAVLVLTAAFLLHTMTNGAGTGGQQMHVDGPQTVSLTPAAANGQSRASAAAVRVPLQTGATNTLLFRVVDAQTGEGIPKAKVAVNYVAEGKWRGGDDLITDAQGSCQVPLPAALSRLDIGALKDGYVQKYYTWRKDYETPLPSAYALRLERGVAIGGWVQDESGQAIRGAEISMDFAQTSDSTDDEPVARERLGFIRDLVATKSDDQGHWVCTIIPENCRYLNLEFRHPELAKTKRYSNAFTENDPPGLAMKDLLACEARVVMKRGFRVTGSVLDAGGHAVSGAEVNLLGYAGFPSETATTIADGTFCLTGLSSGTTRIGASAGGFAPACRAVAIQSNISDLVFYLERGTTVSLRIVDEQSNGVAGAWVAADGPHQYGAEWRATSNAEGWARTEGVPEGDCGSLQFHAGAEGFFRSRYQRVDLSANEPKLLLCRALRVSGSVVDADSRKPIASFKAIPDYGSGGRDRSERKLGSNGVFTVTFTEFQPPFRVRVEADGYEPVLSAPIPLEPREQWIELKLQRKATSKAIRGVVLLPNGLPAIDAEVALLTFERGAALYRGRFLSQGGYYILTRTDIVGGFQFDHDTDAHTVMAVHAAGFGRTRIRFQGEEIVIQLLPFGRIDGRVRTRDGKWTNRPVVLVSPHSELGFSVQSSATSDAEGCFSIESLPAGNYTLHLNPGDGQSFTDATPVEVRAGGTTEAQIGGTGVSVVGRLVLAGSGLMDWGKQTKIKAVQPTASPPPGDRLLLGGLRFMDRAERERRLDLIESDEWRSWARNQRPLVALKVRADGFFTAEALRAGEYTLRVDLAAEPAEMTGSATGLISFMTRPTIASVQRTVVITEAQEQAGEMLDLGIVELQPVAQKSKTEANVKIVR